MARIRDWIHRRWLWLKAWLSKWSNRIALAGLFALCSFFFGAHESSYTSPIGIILPWLVIILAGIFGAFIAIEEDKQQKRNLAAFFVFLTILDLGFWPLSWLTINGVPISTGFTVGSMIAYAIYALRANASTDGSKASETVRNLILFFLDQPTFLHLRV